MNVSSIAKSKAICRRGTAGRRDAPADRTEPEATIRPEEDGSWIVDRRVRRGSGSVHVGSQVSILVPWRLGRGMLSEVVGIIILIAIVPTMSSASGREKICIVGSGNWGSAIATVVGRNAGRLDFCHDEVNMWVRSATILSVFIAGLWLLTQCHWSGVRREDPDRRG